MKLIVRCQVQGKSRRAFMSATGHVKRCFAPTGHLLLDLVDAPRRSHCAVERE